MALAAILEQAAFDALPDVVKEHFKETDGKFHLEVIPTDGFALENVTGLKSALEKERGNQKGVSDQLARYTNGIPDLDEALKTIGRIGELDNWNPGKKVEEGIKERLAEVIGKHKETTDGKDTEIGTLTKELTRHLIESVAGTALSKHEALSNELLLPHVLKQCRMTKDGDRFFAEVINPETGVPRVGNGNADRMTISQLVEEMKGMPEYAPAFKGSGKTGTGSAGSQSDAGTQSAGTQPTQTISASDHGAISANLGDIASGKVAVDMGS